MTKVDGLRAYKRHPLTGEDKKRYDENYDLIFGKKEKNLCDTKATGNHPETLK
jgi:hypothetical protein